MKKSELKLEEKLLKSTKQNKGISVVELPKSNYKVNIFTRDIKYLKVKDVKRSFSKLIQDFCKGLVSNDDARTLTYLFSSYLQLIRDIEFEERLQQLEDKVDDEKKY